MSAKSIADLIEDLAAPDEDLALDAIDRLSALGTPAVEPLLAFVTEGWRRNPSVPVPDGWNEAVTVLGNIRDPAAVGPLLDAYDSLAANNWVSGWSTRDSLVEALGRIGDPRARGLLESVATSDPIERIREEATRYLAKLPAV